MTLLEYFANRNSQEGFILKAPLASKICGSAYWKKNKSLTTLMLEADVFSANELQEFTKSLNEKESFHGLSTIQVTPMLIQEAKEELVKTAQEISDKRLKMCICHKNKMHQLADAMEKESTQYYKADNQLAEQLQKIKDIDTTLEWCEPRYTNDEEKEGDFL